MVTLRSCIRCAARYHELVGQRHDGALRVLVVLAETETCNQQALGSRAGFDKATGTYPIDRMVQARLVEVRAGGSRQQAAPAFFPDHREAERPGYDGPGSPIGRGLADRDDDGRRNRRFETAPRSHHQRRVRSRELTGKSDGRTQAEFRRRYIGRPEASARRQARAGGTKTVTGTPSNLHLPGVTRRPVSEFAQGKR